jgi:cytosolic carboxypeptidase protein 2/3
MTSLVEQKLTESRWLLDNYDFHIIPMVNVDGVIYGNFRCDLAGYDLNRAWKNPLEQIHPQIFHIKREISKISDKYQVEMCLDLHTHSKEYGSFAYCCVDSQ